MGLRTPFNPIGSLPKSSNDADGVILILNHDLTETQLNYTTPSFVLSSAGMFTVDWGDGTKTDYTSNGGKTHTFPVAREYQVKVIDKSHIIKKIDYSPSSWQSSDFVFGIEKLESPTITSLFRTFLGCKGLVGSVPDLSKCPNVTDIEGIFQNCSGLTGEIPNVLNCVNLTTMRSAFSGCTGLTGSIPDISNCVNLTNMYGAFSGCTGLTGSIPDLSKCVNLITIQSMFSGCSGLTGSIPDLSKCTKLIRVGYAFNSCSGITCVNQTLKDILADPTLIAQTWTNINADQCVLGTSVDIRTMFPASWGGLEGVAGFVYRHTLTSTQLDYSTQSINNGSKDSFIINWGDNTRDTYTTGGVKTHTFAEAGTYDVSIVDQKNVIVGLTNSPSTWRSNAFTFMVKKFESQNLTNLSMAFYKCSGMVGNCPDLSKCPNLTNIKNVFQYCSNLTGTIPDISKCTKLIDISVSFQQCSKLTGDIPDISKCPNITTLAGTFKFSANLTGSIPDLSKLTKLTDINTAFYGCNNLTGTIPDISQCTKLINLNGAFRSCTNLTGSIPDMTPCVNITNIGYAFQGCENLTGSIPSLSTLTKVTTATYAFQGCIGLTGEVPDFTTWTNITGTTRMFKDCAGLTTVNEQLANALSSNASISATWAKLPSSGVANTVENCSASVRAVFPTTWGGTRVIS